MKTTIDGYTLTLIIKPYSDFKTCDLERFVAFLSCERDSIMISAAWNIGLYRNDPEAFCKTSQYQIMKYDVLAEAQEKWAEICEAVELEMEKVE